MSLGKILGIVLVIALIAGAVGWFTGILKIGSDGIQVDASKAEMDPYTKGYTQMQSLQYKEALTTYMQALKEKPDDPNAATAQFQLGKCYAELKQPDQAVVAYDTFIKNYPNDSRVEEAKKIRERIASLNP